MKSYSDEHVSLTQVEKAIEKELNTLETRFDNAYDKFTQDFLDHKRASNTDLGRVHIRINSNRFLLWTIATFTAINSTVLGALVVFLYNAGAFNG